MEKRLEQLREDLYQLVEKKGSFLDEEVLKKSQEIDELLNLINNITRYTKAV